MTIFKVITVIEGDSCVASRTEKLRTTIRAARETMQKELESIETCGGHGDICIWSTREFQETLIMDRLLEYEEF